MSLLWNRIAIPVLKMTDEEFNNCLQRGEFHEDWANRGYLPIWLTARKIGRDITEEEAKEELYGRYYPGGEYKGKRYPRGIVFTYRKILSPYAITHELGHAILQHNNEKNFDEWILHEIDASFWAYNKHRSKKELNDELRGIRKFLKSKKAIEWFDNIVARKVEEIL